MGNQKQYSKAYSKLVKDKDDLEGIIAYSIYKEDKEHEIKRLTDEFGSATDGKVLLFIKSRTTDEEINKYRNLAHNRLQNFLENFLEKKSPEIEQDIINNRKSWIKAYRKEIGPKYPFWSGVLQSVLGAFFFAMFIVGITLYSEHNEGKLAKQWFGTEHQDKSNIPAEAPSDSLDLNQMEQLETN